MEPNLAELAAAVAAAVPDRECLVWRDQRRTWARTAQRIRRLANLLRAHGLTLHRERDVLASHESGQDHVALCLYNGPEYLESMLGCFTARAVPVNVNYKYTPAELVPLLAGAGAKALIYHASFAPTVAAIRRELPELKLLLQVADASDEPLLDGALEFETALAGASPERPDVAYSPDDLYVLYTGGTTGSPKGVLWRQADIYFAALGGRKPDGTEVQSMDEVVARARKGGLRYMPTAPFMHAAHWVAFDALLAGNTVVIQDDTRRLDAASILATAEREKVNVILIVGDAFARPLIDELKRRAYDLSALRVIGSGGAVLDPSSKEELLALLPYGVKIIDTVGSSETGTQASHATARGKGDGGAPGASSDAGGAVRASSGAGGTFRANPGARVLNAARTRLLEPGEDEIGWFAQSGRIPLGYLGDAAKSAQTFPTVDGKRYSVPGDRARLLADGSVQVLGRDSMTINSGGEKIFAEEVEQALKRHPAVLDAIVVGRPSARWGSEVAAVVQLRPGASASPDELAEECRRHLARYKVPKHFVVRERVERGPSGKADYAWARAQVAREDA
ncbi:acyl-CoA synthetase [Candidatus Binatia bacterium]|nr:acyl-CoA synthetase [Candidatus Binatia bacterium]